MPPAGLITEWEAAYRRYGEASEWAARAVPGDRDAAAVVAVASRRVAVLWRDLAADPGLPWWMLAALRAAAEAFEQQARDWHARATQPQPPTHRRPDRLRDQDTGGRS